MIEMTRAEFRQWVEERTVNKKIKKKLLIDMGFLLVNGAGLKHETGLKYLEHGDVLCAVRRPDKSYAVRSTFSTHEQPFLTQTELINHLSKVGEDY